MQSATPSSLAAELVEKLGKPIARGKWTTDSPFPTEQQLSAEHNLSRSVVREAIKVLKSKGLVDSRPKRGAQILTRESWNYWDTDVLRWIEKDRKFFEDLAEFRLSVEPNVASLCAERATSEQKERILNLAQDLKTYGENAQYDRYDEADFDFHQAIADACGNVLMQQMMKTLNPLISLNRARTHNLSEGVDATVPLHLSLATAINKGQAKKAGSLMKQIIEEARHFATNQ
ncbi:FadR/GntR family transcriptional regulator [Pelagicoccus mobilis]|uniref:FadR family transcriptional regulator n=1 Tax=Pelagicoccus mobilis TaxID=415221 RepID=A0A934S493_9BACT|nr:FadR/GntR family transcriptional regulator [Pelagicoccus mobilis]MBK1879099.1 FadR family transcriptional regulator [Pelagicoccus mobilis]